MKMENTTTGILSPVPTLRVRANSSSIAITWTAPFSLDVTDVHPDIRYSVLIHNITAEANSTAVHVPCPDCVNITATHYTFTTDYPSPCHRYNISVLPLNGAGVGPPHHAVLYLNDSEMGTKICKKPIYM